MASRVRTLSMQHPNDGYASPNSNSSPSNGDASAQALMRRPNYGDESPSGHASPSNGGASAGSAVMGFDVMDHR